MWNPFRKTITLPAEPAGEERPDLPVLFVDDLPQATASAMAAPVRHSWHDGEKFPGGLGDIEVLLADYWGLRARSSALFEKNLYARGVVRRLVTNEINTGLHLESTPEEVLLGYEEQALSDWTESTENLFGLWANSAKLCDHTELRTFGQLQQVVRMEALVAGDVLVTLIQDPRTGLPRVRVINGSAVQSPLELPPNRSNDIRHGVELDPEGRQVAYWVRRKGKDGMPTYSRLPAFGPKTGRRTAWLVYGTDRRLDDVRGKPLLALVLQSLSEIDRYRDSTQRKAVINSMLALYLEKTEDRPSSKALSGAGVGARRRTVDGGLSGTGSTTEAPRTHIAMEHIPGLVIEELQVGETPKSFPSTGTDEKFGDFERAIVNGIGWSLEIPPEVLTLKFGSNYSASQAALNEFKMYLNRVRTSFASDVCQPIYSEWFLSQVIEGRLKAQGFLDAWRDLRGYEVVEAWLSSDWAAAIKPSADPSKLVNAYEKQISLGLITRDRAAKELNGTKYSKNVQRLARENAQLREALQELEPEPSEELEEVDVENDEPAKPSPVRAIN